MRLGIVRRKELLVQPVGFGMGDWTERAGDREDVLARLTSVGVRVPSGRANESTDAEAVVLGEDVGAVQAEEGVARLLTGDVLS